MRILSIDPGFERVGMAVLEKDGSEETLLYSDCFKTSPKQPFEERLFAVGEKLERLFKKYKPESFAIETLFFNTNKTTAMRVAEVRGMALYIARCNKLSVHEYTPLQIKTAVTGYGRADKRQVSLMVEKLLSLDASKKRLDDEYDAIAVALTHSACVRSQLSTA